MAGLQDAGVGRREEGGSDGKGGGGAVLKGIGLTQSDYSKEHARGCVCGCVCV